MGVDAPNKLLENRQKISNTKQQKSQEEKDLINYHYKQNCIEKYGVDNPSKLSSVTEKRKQTCLLKYGQVTNLLSEECKEKTKITCLQKYGVETSSQASWSQEAQEKRKQTCLKLYDNEFYIQSEQFKEKYVSTMLQKYNVDNPMKNEQIKLKLRSTKLQKYNDPTYTNKDKTRQTCIERYGVPCSLQGDVVMEKIRQTNMNKYGCPWPTQSTEIKEKMKRTCLQKYGVICSLQSVPAKVKSRSTCLKRYGVTHFSKSRMFAIKRRSKYKYENIYFDSLPELAVYMYYLSIGVKIVRCPIILEYKFENELHTYIPDFLIEDKLVEIKGDIFFDDSGKMINPFKENDQIYEAKHQCMISNGVDMWTSKQYQQYVDWFLKNYNKENYKIR